MTIYKWWPSREALLIDAFLHQRLADAAAAEHRHAGQTACEPRLAYAKALHGEFGKSSSR